MGNRAPATDAVSVSTRRRPSGFDPHLRPELLRGFQHAQAPDRARSRHGSRRTVAELLAAAERQADYDQAVQLVQDLHDVAARTGQSKAFALRLGGLREQHARKVSLIERLDRAGLVLFG